MLSPYAGFRSIIKLIKRCISVSYTSFYTFHTHLLSPFLFLLRWWRLPRPPIAGLYGWCMWHKCNLPSQDWRDRGTQAFHYYSVTLLHSPFHSFTCDLSARSVRFQRCYEDSDSTVFNIVTVVFKTNGLIWEMNELLGIGNWYRFPDSQALNMIYYLD